MSDDYSYFPRGFTVETLGALLRALTLEGKGNLPVVVYWHGEPVRSTKLGFGEPQWDIEEDHVQLY